ncbi:MAG: hypothetical protein JWM64_859 [Frankiales bacterium]|nr:hypothetical protein [Frankiales bacterium]
MTEQQQAAGPSQPETRSRPLDPRPYATAAGPSLSKEPPAERSAPAAEGSSGSLAAGTTPVTTTVPRPVPRTGATTGDRVPRSAATSGTRARRARLRLKRIDPWSVFVLSLIVSAFLAVVIVVAVVVLYSVLQAAGVPDSINTSLAELTRKPGEAEPGPFLSAGRAITVAVVLALVDVVLVTALATLSAVLYNLCAGFTGGLEVTLAEHDG